VPSHIFCFCETSREGRTHHTHGKQKKCAIFHRSGREGAHFEIQFFVFLFFSKKEQQIKQKRKAKQQGQNEARKNNEK
jgi:hypothetical protein